jgi:hypothetical protein
MWCFMVVGFVRGVWHFVQVHFGGCMICVGVFCFCLVVPLCPFGVRGSVWLWFVCICFVLFCRGVWMVGCVDFDIGLGRV